jgi:phage shock protein PspC (stress-responsive transcriptional regulator)
MYHGVGFGFGYVLVQVLFFLLIVAWVVASLVALVGLKKVKLSAIAKALWVIILLGIPVLGVVAYFIIKPSEEE